MIGVNIKAGRETLQTVPYLTFMDYCKGVREFTEIADYLVLNIAEETHTAGI